MYVQLVQVEQACSTMICVTVLGLTKMVTETGNGYTCTDNIFQQCFHVRMDR